MFRPLSTRVRPRRRAPQAAALTVLLAAVLAVAGCFNPFNPDIRGPGKSSLAPIPKDPSNTLRLLEWAYNNRDYSQYRTLFTDDYRFAFGARDTAGDRYRGDLWTRIDEIESTRKLFEGGDAQQPAASSINLQLDKSFTLFPDDRPGKSDPLRRKSIRTQVVLNIVTVEGGAQNIQGKARFYLVRGDSALIPEELGLPPDVNRWYIERWEDETLGSLMTSTATVTLHRTMIAAFGPPSLPAEAEAAERAPRVARPVSLGSDAPWSTWGQIKLAYR